MKKREKGHYLDPQISIDPMGSYTGIPVESGEKPIQDADDL